MKQQTKKAPPNTESIAAEENQKTTGEKHSVGQASGNEREEVLEEYRTLRSEILNAQGRRLQTISLTVGALGVVLSISADAVLGANLVTVEERLEVAVGGAIALYAILIPSLIMTMSTQQTIQRLGEYIRIFIEPRVSGLQWEQKWHDFKIRHNYRGGLRGMGGIYYFLSLLPLLLPLYVVSQNPQNWLLSLVLIPFLAWSIYLSYDLQASFSKSWVWARWDDVTS